MGESLTDAVKSSHGSPRHPSVNAEGGDEDRTAMDVATVVSLIISIVSLLAAAYIGIMQYTTQKRSNSVSANFEILAQLQAPGWLDDFDFVVAKLNEYSPDSGLAELPPEVREKLLKICYFLQHVAMLIILDLIDEQTFVAYFRARTIAIWEAAGPFIQNERKINPIRGVEFFTPLEAFAAKARGYAPEVGQEIIARWLARDRKTKVNAVVRFTGRRKVWMKAYSDAMKQDRLSPPVQKQDSSAPSSGSVPPA
jgi:hypothetical protein